MQRASFHRRDEKCNKHASWMAGQRVKNGAFDYHRG